MSLPKKPVFVLLGGGFVLALGGCALFVASSRGNPQVVFGSVFFLGTLMTLTGLVYGLALFVSWLRNR